METNMCITFFQAVDINNSVETTDIVINFAFLG